MWLNVVKDFLDSLVKVPNTPDKALKKLKCLVQDCIRDGSILDHMKFVLVTGDNVSSILKVAEDMQADLIIIIKARHSHG